MNIKTLLFAACLVCAGIAFASGTDTTASRDSRHYPWIPDNHDGTYTNPVIHADYSDPDVIRAGEAYYLVSSSFGHTPALPVLQSFDLVNWTIIGHCLKNLPWSEFDRRGHGNGVWAPSIRFHKGEFYVYFGDPDRGIFLTRAKKITGPWSKLVCVKQAKGWIDPCPLWDDDGNAYLVHAWAKSRAGFNSVLTVNRMNPEGTSVIDTGVTVFDGHANHPTMEGPKFYKRNHWYYIFAPAGGVKPGWQTVLRSKNIFGPYEDKIVLDQGRTSVNGPHQGAWIDTPSGEDWFIHFQDVGAFGRIVHLEPMVWKDDWPVIGREVGRSGKGEPVSVYRMPEVPHRAGTSVIPQTSDEFTGRTLGLQWQWQGNHKQDWYELRKGRLRLSSRTPEMQDSSLWDAPNLLLQKFPARAFTVTARLSNAQLRAGERTGLVVFGMDYCSLHLKRDATGSTIELVTCADANRSGREHIETARKLPSMPAQIDLRVDVDTSGVCRFSVCTDGTSFVPIGGAFTSRAGLWVGAKVGLYAQGSPGARTRGYAEYEYFRFN